MWRSWCQLLKHFILTVSSQAVSYYLTLFWHRYIWHIKNISKHLFYFYLSCSNFSLAAKPIGARCRESNYSKHQMKGQGKIICIFFRYGSSLKDLFSLSIVLNSLFISVTSYLVCHIWSMEFISASLMELFFSKLINFKSLPGLPLSCLC